MTIRASVSPICNFMARYKHLHHTIVMYNFDGTKKHTRVCSVSRPMKISIIQVGFLFTYCSMTRSDNNIIMITPDLAFTPPVMSLFILRSAIQHSASETAAQRHNQSLPLPPHRLQQLWVPPPSLRRRVHRGGGNRMRGVRWARCADRCDPRRCFAAAARV